TYLKGAGLASRSLNPYEISGSDKQAAFVQFGDVVVARCRLASYFTDVGAAGTIVDRYLRVLQSTARRLKSCAAHGNGYVCRLWRKSKPYIALSIDTSETGRRADQSRRSPDVGVSV